MSHRKNIENYHSSEDTRISNFLRSFVVRVIGLPLVIGSIATVYTKGAELLSDIFLDNPDFPSRIIGLYTGLGFAAIGAYSTAINTYESHPVLDEGFIKHDATIARLDEYRRTGATYTDGEFGQVEEEIWEGIVERLREEPES